MKITNLLICVFSEGRSLKDFISVLFGFSGGTIQKLLLVEIRFYFGFSPSHLYWPYPTSQYKVHLL